VASFKSELELKGGAGSVLEGGKSPALGEIAAVAKMRASEKGGGFRREGGESPNFAFVLNFGFWEGEYLFPRHFTLFSVV